MSTEENKALVRRAIEEVANRGNLDVIDELYAANVVGHDMWPHPLNLEMMEEDDHPSLAERKRFTAGWRASFPDTHTTIEQLMAEGDRVMYQATVRGTHTGEHDGVAPTGNQVAYTRFSVVRIAAGKIAEEWFMWDRLGVCQQLDLAAGIRTGLARAERAA